MTKRTRRTHSPGFKAKVPDRDLVQHRVGDGADKVRWAAAGLVDSGLLLVWWTVS